MVIKTAKHVLDILRTEKPSHDRDMEILTMVPLVLKQMNIWGKHLHEALHETVRMNTFGSNPVKTCEEAWLENQCLAIGCSSR